MLFWLCRRLTADYPRDIDRTAADAETIYRQFIDRQRTPFLVYPKCTREFNARLRDLMAATPGIRLRNDGPNYFFYVRDQGPDGATPPSRPSSMTVGETEDRPRPRT